MSRAICDRVLIKPPSTLQTGVAILAEERHVISQQISSFLTFRSLAWTLGRLRGINMNSAPPASYELACSFRIGRFAYNSSVLVERRVRGFKMEMNPKQGVRLGF
jgi:hypothetical protein